MTGHFDAAPLVNQCAIRANDEGASLDAAHLLAVHIFQLEGAEQIACRFTGIREQREGQGELGFEIFMRFDAVARNTHDFAIFLLEFFMQIAKLLSFGRAARRIVLGVKVNDQMLAARAGQNKGVIACGGQRKICNGIF